MTINWSLKKFDNLSPAELYAILQLRSEVFVVEQNCVFLDMDDKDQYCYHLMGWLTDEAGTNKLVATTRIVPPGVIYNIPSVGRVVTSPIVRGNGTGRVLMEKSIEETYRHFGKQPIKIGAQLYLLKFYSSLGFAPISEVYLEDGIEHIEMLLS
jgi:ElaA protein